MTILSTENYLVKLLFIIVTLFYSANARGQLKTLPGQPRELTKKEMEDDERNQNCTYYQKYSAQQRLKLFPFSQAKEIRIVSFKQPDSLIMGGGLPLSNGIVDRSKLNESKLLSRVQIDTLTDILYNRSFGGPFYTNSESSCYNPRNAILFLDLQGKVFAFIELCFECYGHRLSSSRVVAGDFCSQKYDLLKSFFVTNRITYGVLTEEENEE